MTVQDTGSGYSAPYPQYDVTFQRATPLRIYIDVQLASNVGVPADAETLIRQALALAFNGADGGSRARIGATLFASRFYAGIAALGPWVQIVSINVGTTANPVGDRVTVNMNQVPSLADADVTVELV